MVHIPSLTQVQLEILRLAKENPGETLQLSFESPVMGDGEPRAKNPSLIQEMIDFGLVEIQKSRVYCEISRFQRECWFEYCADIELPSIYAWELWRKEFINSQEGSTTLITPGEEFEDFSYVWVQEMEFQAVQPG
ncbi:hypothetical protein HRE53_27930 (plasmid) [Acaryochloris sp. 'Moss Beach']|uniref:hypothetical protein n=1 Tax=Acaryochloris sp. 'Moss Beach' TaxID=2740837 RepID=UPI001F304560|nr:hypothetical protein [Acaryochloris sp. 'Moss Beach']UJB72721.1 hypothetical protein HRE53_27930 [Acaryochloris sp. 'Moss Beach']